MPIVSSLGALSSRGFGEFSQQTSAATKYIEDYFSTWLYTGTGANQLISNNIALNNKISNTQYTPADFDAGLSVDSSGSIQFVGRSSTTINGYRNGSFNSAITIPAGETTISTYLNSCSDSSGNNYYLFITSDGTNSHTNVVKTDSTGSSILWVRRVSNNANFNGITTDGTSVYIAGYTGLPNYYGVVQKISCSTGAITWTVGRTQAAGVYLYSTCLDSSGNIYACGYTGSAYAYLVKISSAGSVLTQNNFQGNGATTSANSVFVDSSGNIFTAGKLGGTQYFIRKQNSSFVEQWARTFTVTANGQIYVSADSTTCAVSFADATTSLQYYAIINSSTGDLISCNSVSGYISNYYNKPPIYLGGNLYLPNSTSIYVVSASSAATGTPIFSGLPLSYTSTSVTWTTTTQPTAATWSYSTSTPSMSISKTSYSLSGTANAEVLSSGGLVWMKGRSGATDHALYDTARGATFDLVSNSTAAQTTQTTGLTSFTASGFSIGSLAKINTSSATYVSWTWRETPKFFDVVTYTGDGTTGRSINHNLGSSPGMIIFKRTDTASQWPVWHRSLSANNILFLNLTDASTSSSGYVASVSSTTFTINANVNSNGGTFVAYLFAHDAGGFGLDGSQNVISCGSYTGNGSATGPSITLGYEPQFVLIKSSSNALNWHIVDVMRGMTVDQGSTLLYPNLTNADGVATGISITPTPTGFQVNTVSTSVNTNGATYIYMAIRRGPMKVPTDATTVFSPITANAVEGTQQTTNFPIDSQWKAIRAGNATNSTVDDRLRGNSSTTTSSGRYWLTNSGAAEATTNATTRLWDNTGFQIPTFYASASSVFYSFRRAPSFMDVVCYTGTGTARTVTHNLGAVPELMMVKRRDTTAVTWVYNATTGNTNYLNLSTTAAAASSTAAWNNTSPTSSVFTVGTATQTNASAGTYVAYLFSSCPGVSKVGTYLGTGGTQTIDCGFTGGARYVMIKRTDDTASWWFWDTARGMVAGTDPRIGYDLTTAEQNANWVYTTTGGFQIVNASSDINLSVALTWTARTSNFGTTNINAATFGSGVYVIAGDSGTIASSTNGTTWTLRTSGFGTTSINAASFGNGLFLIGGGSGTLASSTNGTSWTNRTSNFGTDTINAITYGNSLYLLAGANGKIATSTTGTGSYTVQTSGTAQALRAATYGNGLFIVGGDNGTLLTSPDGVTWTSRTSQFGTDNINGLIYAGGLFVACGQSGKISTSSDGITWTAQTSGVATALNAITYSSSTYFVGGNSGVLRGSTDGITWTSRTSGFGSSAINALTVGSGTGADVFVAAGVVGTVTTSPTAQATYIYLAIA